MMILKIIYFTTQSSQLSDSCKVKGDGISKHAYFLYDRQKKTGDHACRLQENALISLLIAHPHAMMQPICNVHARHIR